MCRPALRHTSGIVERPVPADGARFVRIGDAERDAAAAELGEHFALGRLDPGEFSTRLDSVLAARTQGELDRVFVDLPRTRRARATSRRDGGGYPVVPPVAVLVTMLLIVASVAAANAGIPPFFLIALVWVWRGHRHAWK